MITTDRVIEPDEATSVLDGIEGVRGLTVGWAVWTLREGRLASSIETLTWPARRPAIARCAAERHVAPAPDCACGVRAVTESGAAEAVRRQGDGPVLVGCVALWGRVEDGRSPAPGWRAKRAYPLFVVADDGIPTEQRRELAATYGIPVYRASDGVASLFAEHRQVVWWTVRNRLQSIFEVGSAATSTDRAVAQVLDAVVTTWAAAEQWRRDRAARPAIAVPGPLTAPADELPTPQAVPDVAGIVVAWRSWNLSGDRLASVTRADRWRGREAMVARCRDGSHQGVPGRTCTCGIYAARKIDYAARYHAAGGGASVFGCVALWGGLVEASYGWRAEKAYPLVLFAPATVSSSTRRALERAYGVPVHRVDAHGFGPSVVGAGEELRAALERGHGRLAGPTTLDAFLEITRSRAGTGGTPISRAPEPGATTPYPGPTRPAPIPRAGRVSPSGIADRLGLEWSRTAAVGLVLIVAAIMLAVFLGVHG
jgi:hypothetical protein